jgi:L-aminopeptidase/D-esterase-like protein
VNTPFDGDVVFAVSTAEAEETLPPTALLSLGVVARDLVEEAVRRGVTAPDPISDPSDTDS